MSNNNYVESLIKDIAFFQGLKSWVKKEEPDYSEAGYRAIDEKLVLLKRELRNEYRRQKYESERERVYESRDGQSKKTFFIDCFDSPEEAREWEEKTWRNGQVYSDYSPTGMWFVSDTRAAHIEGNRWLCMVETQIDI